MSCPNHKANHGGRLDPFTKFQNNVAIFGHLLVPSLFKKTKKGKAQFEHTQPSRAQHLVSKYYSKLNSYSLRCGPRLVLWSSLLLQKCAML